MSTAKAKGDALEYAVFRIQEALIESTPELRGANAMIERNKVIEVDGVPHEVDLWLTISPHTAFAAHHLIECKNWSKPVGKDVVMSVGAKREELRAAKAFIIAHAFTQPAIAMAKKLGVTLTSVSDDFVSCIDNVEWVFTTHEPVRKTLTIHFRDRNAPAPSIRLESSYYRNDGRFGPLSALVEPEIEAHLRKLGRSDARAKLDGLHFGRTSFGVSYDRGEMFINEVEVEAYTTMIEYLVEFRTAMIEVKFSINEHGGFYRLVPPPGLLGGDDLKIEILTKPKPISSATP